MWCLCEEAKVVWCHSTMASYAQCMMMRLAALCPTRCTICVRVRESGRHPATPMTWCRNDQIYVNDDGQGRCTNWLWQLYLRCPNLNDVKILAEADWGRMQTATSGATYMPAVSACTVPWSNDADPDRHYWPSPPPVKSSMIQQGSKAVG